MRKKMNKENWGYVIAYGSNLNRKQMRERCPDAKAVARGLLDDARLVFRGAADLAYEPGHLAPAVIWHMPAWDERALDAYEGVNRKNGAYSKFYVKFLDRKCALYLMNDRGVFPPSAWYASIIRDGYRQFKLDESYLDHAIKHAFEDKEPSAQTTARRKRQKNTAHHRKLVAIPEAVAIARMERQRELASMPDTCTLPQEEKKNGVETLAQYLKRAYDEGIKT